MSRPSAGMTRLIAATAKLPCRPLKVSTRPLGLSKFVHASAAGAANKNKKRQTKAINLKRHSEPPQKAVPAIQSGTGVSEKIQVVPFNMMPKEVLMWARAASMKTVMKTRGITKPRWSWHFYHLLRTCMGLSFKTMIPKVLRWKAIYLPVWNVDHDISLDQRVSYINYQVQILSLDTTVPATHVEPLASVPLRLPPSSEYADEAEPYNLQTHLIVFKYDDMPKGEAVVRPIVIPFSAIVPDLENMYRKSASVYQSDEVSFPGEVRLRSQAAYPMLLPYYLVEVAEGNPYYESEPVTTCLIMGRKFPNLRVLSVNVSREGAWLEKEVIPAFAIVNWRPKPKEGGNFANLPYYSRIREDLGVTAITQLVKKAFQHSKVECTKLDPKIRLSEVGKAIDPIGYIMKFANCAKANREYALAKAKARHAAYRLRVAKEGRPDSTLSRIIFFSIPVPVAVPSLFSRFLSSLMTAKKSNIGHIQELQTELDAAKEKAQSSKPPWLH